MAGLCATMCALRQGTRPTFLVTGLNGPNFSHLAEDGADRLVVNVIKSDHDLVFRLFLRPSILTHGPEDAHESAYRAHLEACSADFWVFLAVFEGPHRQN